MLGIVCAMASEAKPVLDLMTEVKNETFAKKQFYVGNLLGKKAVLCVSDIGKVNSSLGATLCILKYGATVILNFGVVGAIDPSLKLGDIVVGTSAMQYDFDLSLPNGIDRGQLSNFNDKHIALTQKYVDEFAKLGFKTGRLATTDAFKFNYDNWCYCREWSTPTTSHPRRRNSRAAWKPMKPAWPVTSIFMFCHYHPIEA